MKSWQDLKLTDDYLFSQIMREEDFCKLFLEMLMGIKVEKVVYLEAQSAGKRYPHGRLSRRRRGNLQHRNADGAEDESG